MLWIFVCFGFCLFGVLFCFFLNLVVVRVFETLSLSCLIAED